MIRGGRPTASRKWRFSMPARQGNIFANTEDAKWEELFQKTIEAIELFDGRPDLLRGFVDAIKARNLASQRQALNAPADRWRQQLRASADFEELSLRRRNA
jgi:hypothetical protein